MATKWSARWEFSNVHSNKDGAGGQMEVEAENETAARKAIKDRASVQLFGTTGMHVYIQVRDLREARTARGFRVPT